MIVVTCAQIEGAAEADEPQHGIAKLMPGDRENSNQREPHAVAAVSITRPGRTSRSAAVVMMSVPIIEPAPCAALRSPYPVDPALKYWVGVDGQERDVRQPEQRVEEGQADQAGEDEVVTDEAQASISCESMSRPSLGLMSS